MAEINPATKGIYYNKYLQSWAKVDTIYNGDEAIKQAGQLYLPKLSGQNPKEYLAYLNRGCFFNPFKRTIQGLTGAVIRKEPVIKVDKIIDSLLPSITLNNESIQEVIRIILDNLFRSGYLGILVDMSSNETINSNPYFAIYPESTIYNMETKQEGSELKLTMLCLGESVFVQDKDNRFLLHEVEQVRLLELIDNVLTITVYQKRVNGRKETWMPINKPIIPQIKGKSLNYIPFVFFGAISNSPIPTPPPLLDLANLNIKHWQLSTDYYHGLHHCGMPTPWAAGFPKSSELYVGALKAWVSEDPSARCGYLEVAGTGIAMIANALEKNELQMAILGARLLEEQKRAAEATDTVRMRYSGDSATLSTIVTSTEQGLIKLLKILGEFVGVRKVNPEVKLNRDFVSERLSAQDISALLQSYLQGGMSLDTFLYNLQVGEILSPDTTIEQEKLKIQSKAEEEREFSNNSGNNDNNKNNNPDFTE